MYDLNGKVIDRREQLRVKIKSLAEEARIIRREERKTHGELREELYRHRMDVVRPAARHALIAYGVIRGKTIDEMEPNRKSEPDVNEVNRLLAKYGPAKLTLVKKAA